MLRRSALAGKGPASSEVTSAVQSGEGGVKRSPGRTAPPMGSADQKLVMAARREKTTAEDRLRRLRQLHKWAAEEARGQGLAVLAERWRTAAREIFDELRSHVRRTAGERPPWASEGGDAAAMGSRALMRALLGMHGREELEPLGASFFSEDESSSDAGEVGSDDEPHSKRRCESR